MPDGPASARPPARRAAARGFHGRALLLKRFDFRESSRVVTLVTREHGVVNALAKGAHRADSPFLGRLDFLNELGVQLSADRGGLRLLLRADLIGERRGLRQPARFVAASHLAAVCHPAFPGDQPDPALFDLLQGGLTLIEKCPLPALPVVVLGLELRLLAHLGALPDLERCGHCGDGFDQGAFRAEVEGGLACRDHAAAPRRAIGVETLALLRALRDQPGRTWPELGRRAPSPAAIALPQTWLALALDARPRLRGRVFEGLCH